jgi:multiple sugar transport system ATP-binding protein
VTTVALQGLSKTYPNGKRAVRELSLDVADGEFVVLLGPSGCGKSTILRMIAGLEKITSGRLLMGGQPANDVPSRDRGVGMVFQGSTLYPHLTVRENLAFPLQLAGVDPADADIRVAEVAVALDIRDILDRQPDTLSGGQRQRVAIGRAIMREPSLFLMDEPLSNVDTGMRAELRQEIVTLVRELGITTLYVTHDQTEALTMADRVAVLRDGRLQDLGTPQQVYSDPATTFVASFLSSPRINLVAARVHAQPRDHVSLALGGKSGGQSLALPWSDPRAQPLSNHHGGPVTLGVRSDALIPAEWAPDAPTLAGRLRFFEYHGTDVLAYVDAGTSPVDEPTGSPPDGEPPELVPRRGRLRLALHRLTHRSTPYGDPDGPGTRAGSEALDHVAKHYRRAADLVLKLPAEPPWQVGADVKLAVDLHKLYLFDTAGRRIDPVHR